MSNVSRRDFFKGGSAMALGAFAATSLAGCGQPTVSSKETETTTASGPSFLQAPDPIADFSETKEFDVVVVGAGESGLSAVHTALDAGAHVACIQKLGTPMTTGNMACSVNLEETDEAAIQACLSFINWRSDYRSNRALTEQWARNSYEAIGWWAEEGATTGEYEAVPYDTVLEYAGHKISLHANTYFHLEGAHNDPAQVIGANLEAAGAEFFYNTTMVQLYTEEGAVKGAIAQTEDGSYILFKATKGVILATGDYTSNLEMRDYYAPDTQGFLPAVDFRDGMGMAAGMWAGAVMQPHCHSKMIHGEAASVRLEMPFLFLDGHGNRFMDETCCRMGYMNNYMRPYMREAKFENAMAARFFSVVPGNWEDYFEPWKANHPYDIHIYNAIRKVDPESWIQADTVEELADKMIEFAQEDGWAFVPDKDAIVSAVNRYNELCDKGADEDFGKSDEFMVPITAPFYAVPRGSHRVSAILGGLLCDGNHQCINVDGDPIEGLFAVGNACGGFYGGVDYPMDIEGLSIGRAITSGYVCGKYVASL